jgi:hypothetical protein
LATDGRERGHWTREELIGPATTRVLAAEEMREFVAEVRR